MIIKSLHVDKFRKLNSFNLDLGKKITIISGHNGTMKSTIMGLLMQPFDVTSKSSIQKLDKENFKTTHLKYPESKFSDHFRFVYPKYDKPKELQATLNLYGGIHGDDEFSFETILRSESNKSKSLRIWTKGDRSSGSGYIKDIPVIFLPISRLYPLQLSNSKTLKPAELSDVEQELFSEMYNEIFKNSNLDIKEIYPLETNIPHKYSFAFETEQYNHVSMSSGEDSVSNIIGAIISIARIRANFAKNKVDYKGSIIFIDEIDASLHPPVQINLMKLLIKYSSKFKIQFVVTTHSIDIIEWAHRKREFCIKNAATANDINLSYLVAQDKKIKCHMNPDLHKIYNHLKLAQSTKIPVYTEDVSAAILLEGLVDSKLLKEIDIKPSKLGSSSLLPIAVSRTFTVTDNVILCLDGDQKKYYADHYEHITPIEQVPNLIFLPGVNNPEHYVYHFLASLEDDHEIWEDELEGYFYKANVFDKAPSKTKFNSHNDEAIAWYTKLFSETISDKSHFFKCLKEYKSEDIAILNNQLMMAIKYTKSSNLMLPSVSLDESTDKNLGFNQNADLLMVYEIYEFAINNDLDYFHPRDAKLKEYNKLSASEKKFIYQLFRSLYTPHYFEELPSCLGFKKR